MRDTCTGQAQSPYGVAATTGLLLPSRGRFVLFHPILPVASLHCQTRVPLQPLLWPLLSPAPPLAQRGRLMPYPSQFALTPLLGRATWDDCGLCNGRREDPVRTSVLKYLYRKYGVLAVLACLRTVSIQYRSWRAHVPWT